MQIDSLLTDSVFELIKNEFIKRSKKRAGPLGEQDYKVALQALVDRIDELCLNHKVFVPAPGFGGQPQVVRQPLTKISDNAAPATPEEIAEMDRRDAINNATLEQRINASREKVYEAVKKVFDQGGNRVVVSKEHSMSEIGPYLKSRGIHFTDLQVGFPAVEPGVIPKQWIMSFER